MKIIKTRDVRKVLKILRTWRINAFVKDGVYISDRNVGIVIKELIRKGIDFKVINQFEITDVLSDEHE